jgi:hypothetical protein
MARIDREMPVNSIWKGAANSLALDGCIARALAQVDGGTDEAQARPLARELALDALVMRALPTEARWSH